MSVVADESMMTAALWALVDEAVLLNNEIKEKEAKIEPDKDKLSALKERITLEMYSEWVRTIKGERWHAKFVHREGTKFDLKLFLELAEKKWIVIPTELVEQATTSSTSEFIKITPF